MRRVVFNQKGGVGKSSITCNLAAISAQQGYKTLVIDLDVQGNTTHYLLGKASTECENNIAQYFEQVLSFKVFNKKPEDFITPSPYENLDVIASSPELEHLERKLEAKHKIYKLRDALKALERKYDRIFVDTAPALNFYTQSALIACNKCLIPFDCDDFSRKALYNLGMEIQEIQEDHNDELKIEGIIVNQFQPRASLPQQLIKELIEEGLPVLPVYLTSSVKMKESHQKNRPLIYMDPKHKLTHQFVELSEVLEGKKVEHPEFA